MTSNDRTPDRARAEQAQGGDYDLALFGDNHVQAYEESNGDVGYIWNGAPILVLTTRGAKSGKVRKHALIYGTDGDDVLLIASQGGAPDNPHWYKNLDAGPERRRPDPRRPFRWSGSDRVPGGEGSPLADDDRAVAGLRRLPGFDRARHPGRDHRAGRVGDLS